MWEEDIDLEIGYVFKFKRKFKMRKDVFSRQKIRKRINGILEIKE